MTKANFYQKYTLKVFKKRFFEYVSQVCPAVCMYVCVDGCPPFFVAAIT